jgi:cyclophilin family peptidyl-prolyl cis-trans isomerase
MLARSLVALVALVQAASAPKYFTSPYALDEMKNTQAVVDTTMGTFVLQLLPEVAPNHVAHFIKAAKDAAYVGTAFHRVIKYGIIQGGDPLTKDPSKAALYGTGGLNELKAEFSGEKYTAGAVAAVLVPNNANSAGSQFFICVTDQPALTGQYTVFARVVDGMDVVQRISAVPANAQGVPETRVEITSVTIRDTPPPAVEPFSTETDAELAVYHVTLETTAGRMTLDLLPDRAPVTVRQFLRLAAAGVYDNSPFHRVVKGFVIQTGSVADRLSPLTQKQDALIHPLPPEFGDTPNDPGMVSMAHGDDPASGTTSFFICSGECHGIDGKYTVFARVASGMDVVKAIDAADLDGERPKVPIVVTRVTIAKPPPPRPQ